MLEPFDALIGTWGGKTANATGAGHGNSPSPGHKASNPDRVQATDRRRCGSKLVVTLRIELWFDAMSSLAVGSLTGMTHAPSAPRWRFARWRGGGEEG